MPNRRRAAFTLIELLVVIGIIALLVGILLPVLASARKAGKNAQCLSNLRSLGQASVLYMTENNKFLPQPSADGDIADTDERNQAVWFNALDYYLGQVVTDGSAADRNYVSYKQDPAWSNLPETVETTGGPVELDEADVRTFKMNVYFGHVNVPGTNATALFGKRKNDPVAFYKTTDVPEPASTVLYGDGRGHDTPTDTGIIDAASTFGGVYLFAMSPLYVGLRHDDGANLTMVDGSAQHQTNPVRETGTGYRGWYDMYADATFTEDDRALWPEATFNFRPESIDDTLTRRYPRKD